MIDDLTPRNPCFLCRFDRKEWLATSPALQSAGLDGAPGVAVGAVVSARRLIRSASSGDVQALFDAGELS